jgi:hypothetical protein
MERAMGSLLAIIVKTAMTHQTSTSTPQLDGLMLFGFLGAVATLVFFSLQSRSPSFVLVFSICSAAMALFAFMQGAWPLGIVECVWSVAIFRRWYVSRKLLKRRNRAAAMTKPWLNESRVTRLFDSMTSEN